MENGNSAAYADQSNHCWLTKENTIKIPVFASMPTMLSAVHLAAKQVVLAELVSLRLEPRCTG